MKIVTLIFIFIFFSCNSKQKSAEKLLYIQVPDELSEENPRLKSFFQKITYLPLETTKESLIGNFPHVTLVDTCILIHSNTGVMLFNVRNGQFIRKIGIQGRGPGEYTWPAKVYNEEKRTVYFTNYANNLMEFDFSGNLHHIIKIPLTYQSKEIEDWSLPANIFTLEDSLYCAFFANTYGQEKKRIIVFNNQGQLIHLFPNYQIVKGYNSDNMGIRFGRGIFYSYNGKTFFKENFSDTIFQVTSHKLIPYVRLNFGKNQKPYIWQYEYFAEITKKHDTGPLLYINMMSVEEDEDKLAFWFYFGEHSYLGIYDKNKQSVNTYNVQHGFVDDLNHFVPIHIHRFLPDGKAIGIINPPEITEWFETHKTDSLHPDILKLKNITLDDNPVVVLLE